MGVGVDRVHPWCAAAGCGCGNAQTPSVCRRNLPIRGSVPAPQVLFDKDQWVCFSACAAWISSHSYSNMMFFANTRTKRTTAFAMLLVWVFALASGVANACFLETPAHHATAAKGSAATTSQAAAELLAHLDATAGHHDDSNSTKETCLKVCDDGTHTLPKGSSGVDLTDPGPPPLVTTLGAGSVHVVSTSGRVDDMALPMVGPSIRVRYSRLVL